MSEAKVVEKAAENNKEPIFKVLEKVIPEKFGADASLSALEISSGSGQHVVYFAERFPKISFQPSDIEDRCIKSIKEYISETKLENVKQPLVIDISKPLSEWSSTVAEKSVDVIININMVHITPWECAEGLFAAAGKLLKVGGIMATYGPYAIHGEITPESNVSFNESLKAKNAEWGLRDIDDLEKEAKKNGLTFDAMFDMPANNKTLIWVKSDSE
ncbi:methyltransferase-like 26 [Macrobrachium rosenbergii]|uniref:methyltransferase-like 26 n=1 Tax=Macrobrachium rosenbergii TaxID=79674 RepID=UPI0034D54AE6